MDEGSGKPRRVDGPNLVARAKSNVTHEPVPQNDDPSEAPPATSRSPTLHDPMTTGLLAEVARRTSTMELDPVGTAALRSTVDIDPDTLDELLRDTQPPQVPPVHANTVPRTK